MLLMKNTVFSFSPGLNSFILLGVCQLWFHIMIFVPDPQLAWSCKSQCGYTVIHQQSAGPSLSRRDADRRDVL